MAYCKKLSKTYRDSAAHSRSSRTATVPEAMSKCETAPQTSIPVLEKALTDAKVTLPTSQVATRYGARLRSVRLAFRYDGHGRPALKGLHHARPRAGAVSGAMMTNSQ